MGLRSLKKIGDILAKRQLKSNEPVNLEVINKYLGHFSLSITQEEFDIRRNLRFGAPNFSWAFGP